MLGFGKKKDKDSKGESPAPQAPEKTQEKAGKDSPAKEEKPASAGRPAKADKHKSATGDKKRFPIKKILMTLVILGLLGGGGYAGYTFFLKSGDPSARVFTAKDMPHLTLPVEMLKFSFDHYPDLFDAFVQYETQMVLLEKEIARIKAISAKYPEQQKIADRQKKIWEKGKNTLSKEFAKLEKPIKETFVLFQVNPRQGKAQIDASAADLAARARSALDASQELTADIKAMPPEAPEGLIQGTLFKLKKTFL